MSTIHLFKALALTKASEVKEQIDLREHKLVFCSDTEGENIAIEINVLKSYYLKLAKKEANLRSLKSSSYFAIPGIN